MASSSAHHHHHHHHHHVLPNMLGGATAAPPPTPCTQTNNTHLSTSSDATADALSHLLQRLPPSLSLPTRHSPRATAPGGLPSISMSAADEKPGDNLLSAAMELGYFELTETGIPSELANSAESDSFSFFELGKDQKENFFPKAWPVGYESGDEEEGERPSFCFDADCSTESCELQLSLLREFTGALEKLGLKVVEMLASAVGFENPFGNDPTRHCTLMWVHEGVHGDNKPAVSGGFYPFVVGLQYQTKNHQKYSLLAESGWVSLSPRVDSVLITFGDIAQVWSNGKIKRVRGRPVACSREGDETNKCVTMSLLLTIPMNVRVSPMVPKKLAEEEELESKKIDNEDQEEDDENGERRVFRSFSFRDYAWKVYHERLWFKDPLDKHRIRD